MEFTELQLSDIDRLKSYNGKVNFLGIEANDFIVSASSDAFFVIFDREDFSYLVEEMFDEMGQPSLYLDKAFFNSEITETETLRWIVGKVKPENFRLNEVNEYELVSWLLDEERIIEIQKGNTDLNPENNVVIKLSSAKEEFSDFE